jgi:DnaJ-domain-containing protein 1
MKLDSKYFDSVRVRPDHARPVSEDAPGCQWKGCQSEGVHRAPRGRGFEGQFYLFCLDHVRQFNASYNYFDGMSNAEVEAYQKDSVIGHRPTWKAGANAWAHGTRHGSGRPREAQEARRPLKPLEAKALDSLNLPVTATQAEIKSRFKELVKRHHPDANGGDTRSEDKLREVIQAYNYLKQAGLA